MIRDMRLQYSQENTEKYREAHYTALIYLKGDMEGTNSNKRFKQKGVKGVPIFNIGPEL